jgi:hypothetical protein
MKLISLGLITCLAAVLPTALIAQPRYVRECREAAANRLRVSPSDISADLGPSTPNGNRIVNWEARRGRDRRGYCEFDDRGGRLVRMEVGEYRGPVGDGRRGPDRDRGRDFGDRVDAPNVRVDTSGRGVYNGPEGRSIRITRGWVDTYGPRNTVALSGERNFKINFSGRITRRNGDEFTMEITDSDRGRASGTARFRLNRDRNEVQSIEVNGRINGRGFNGSFSR